MEALVAVGVASNVVQFVDFAGKIIAQTVRIYREKPKDPAKDDPKGKESHYGHLEAMTADLQDFNRDMAETLAAQHSPTTTKLSSTDREILRMCVDCKKIAESLLNAIGKLRGTNKRLWSSFVIALKSVWSEGEISALRQTLDSYRQQMTLYILASVREEIRALQQTQSEREDVLLASVSQTRSVVEDFFEKTSVQGRWEEDIIEAMHDDYKRNETTKHLRASPAIGMESKLNDDDSRRFNEGLLDWIRFRELDNRHEKICAAYEQTFEWIFRDAPSNEWSSFPKWLTDENEQLYWITGKPAAGKSTLLKFIYSDPRTKEYLRDWAQEKRLIFCAFYFWNSGTEMQISQEGMARTLLHSALVQAPELRSLLFPYQLEEYVAYRNPWNRPITWDAIMRAFRLLVEGAGSDYKLFFLIDGLDEYGDDHVKIIDMIQGFISPNVKTCVSSRPWNIFQDSFQQRPSLRLEDITYNDIKLYVGDRFRRSRGFEERRSETPAEANRLIENITQKASGVFLWVALVTDSLLEGLADGERLSDLQARLDSLPTDLETLFWNILSRLPDVHLTRTSQLLQIFRASLAPLNLLMLSYADEDDPEYALKVQVGPRSIDQANARARILQRRLNACCKGLIESKPIKGHPLAEAQVGYLHRTVKDYVEREDNWSRFLKLADDSFNPYVRLCNAHIIEMKIARRDWYRLDPSCAGFWEHIDQAMHYASRVDTSGTNSLQMKLLNELDVAATHVASLKDHQGKTFVNTYDERFLSWMRIKHWTATNESTCLNRNFLHLAVQYQMRDYVCAVIPLHTFDTESLTVALLVSIASRNRSIVPPGQTTNRNPDPKLVRFLLESGADPNQALPNALIYTTRNDSLCLSPWAAYLSSGAQGFGEQEQQIVRAFLDHGADPKLGKKASGSFKKIVQRYQREKMKSKLKRISFL